jgi:hypothetical protein
MRRCVVNSAGAAGYAALWIESSNVVVEDCRIHDNAAAGVYLNGVGLAPVLRRVEVDRNGGWAVVQSTLDMNPAYEGLSVHDNGRDAVYVGGSGTTGRDVVLDGGAVGGVPYVLASSWTVGSGRALTVTAGTAVRFGDNVYLRVDGRLVVTGTATAPITFTTASTTTVVPGRWYFIRFASGSSGVMRRCVVNSAGSAGYAALWIESSNVVVEDCRIHHNAGAGAYVVGSAPTLAGNAIYLNGGPGLVTSNSQPILRGNLFYRNAGFGIRNDTPARTVNARQQAWGHPTGPYHPSRNPMGLGDRVSDGVDFEPWLRVAGVFIPENQPPQAFVVNPAADGFTFNALPLQFRIWVTDTDALTGTTFIQDMIYLRAEIRQGGTVVAVYDQVESPAGWDRGFYRIESSEGVTATLTLTRALPPGDYTIRVTAFDGIGMGTGPERAFSVNLTAWGIASVQPEEILAVPGLTQTLTLYGYGFTSGAQVWLEQVISDTERVDPESVIRVSEEELRVRVNMGGLSGLWDVVVRQGGEERRFPLYVFPYMPVMVVESQPPARPRPGFLLPFEVRVTNAGTAPGVALVMATTPTGTQVITVTAAAGGVEVVKQEGNLALYAIRVEPGDTRTATVWFRIPWEAVGDAPGQLRLGAPLFMYSELLGMTTVEGWELLRAEMDDQTPERLTLLMMAGWMMLEGHYEQRFIDLINWQRARGLEWWERLFIRNPVLASVLIQAAVQAILPAWYEALGGREALPPYVELNFERVLEGSTGMARPAGIGTLQYSGGLWDELKLWGATFKEMFSYEGWETMEASAKAVGAGLVEGLTFGLVRLNPVPDLECRDPYIRMAVEWGRAAGNIASQVVPFPKLRVPIKIRGSERLAVLAHNVNQRLIQFGRSNYKVIASTLDSSAQAALNTLQRVDGAITRLTGKNPNLSQSIKFGQGEPGRRDILLWNKYKLTLSGNSAEPIRLGLSKIVKIGDEYYDVNIFHYGERKVVEIEITNQYGNVIGKKIVTEPHMGYGGSGKPVIDRNTEQPMRDEWGNIIMGAGPHEYTRHFFDSNNPLNKLVDPVTGKSLGDIPILTPEGQLNPQYTEALKRVIDQLPPVNVEVLNNGRQLIAVSNAAEHVVSGVGPSGTSATSDCGGSRSVPLRASWDPNDIQGLPSRVYIDPSQALMFTIRFENVATATAEAETVVVTMTLDPNLDWSALQMLGSSHPDKLQLRADEESRVLVWAFDGINLPPNRNPPEGEGWVRFRVRPKANLGSGTVLTAQAVIVFDVNPPIWTNVITYVIDVTPPVTPTLSDPSVAGDQIRLRVRTRDEHSGLSRLAVYYSRDGGQAWSLGTDLMLTEPVRELDQVFAFSVPGGGDYQIRVDARDEVGMGITSEPITVRVPYRLFLPLVLRQAGGARSSGQAVEEGAPAAPSIPTPEPREMAPPPGSALPSFRKVPRRRRAHP